MKRIAVALATVALLSGCGLITVFDTEETTTAAPDPSTGDGTANPSFSADDPAYTPQGPPEDPRASAVYDQEVTWTQCGRFECATVDVPVDWSNPDGPTVAIAISRQAARDQGSRLGSLLINPGGPGGSGIELLEYFTGGDDLLDSFDIIGFDPRGVGDSTPISCGDGDLLDRYYVQDFFIETQSDMDESAQRTAKFADECRERTGPIVANVDTVSAARDMDVIRAVLGDDELYYLGFSYGTQLGATYAQVYPDTVGRIVLDGAVDFLIPGEEQSLTQAEGFESALTAFLEWCTGRASCPLDDDVEQARAQIARLALAAIEEPYPSEGSVPVNGNLMVYGIVVTLYDEASWEYLEIALTELINRGTARVFYELANFYLDRDGVTNEYLGNSTVAFTAISCLDGAPTEEGDDGEWTIADQREFARQVDEVAPTFGWWFSGGGGCDGWPWEADEMITSLDDAATAADGILVIGTTNDPATPYSWAESLADQLDAPLLTYVGEGHTAYGRSNQCVTDVVDAFLVDGVQAVDDTRC